MPPEIFVNLPVTDLDRSVAFFSELGFMPDPRFTNETAACLHVSEAVAVMLLTHARFRDFTPGPIADAKAGTSVLVCLARPSRAAVDETIAKAVAGGATTFSAPQDHGFMYARAFRDLDGHVWEWIWMNPDADL